MTSLDRPQGAHSLDLQSKIALAGFSLRLGLLSFLLSSWCVLGARPLQAAIGIFAIAASLASLVAGVRGLLSLDRLASSSLNNWDEALAFVALSKLAHAFAL